MATKVTKIVIRINGKDEELTVDAARALCDELRELFGLRDGPVYPIRPWVDTAPDWTWVQPITTFPPPFKYDKGVIYCSSALKDRPDFYA